LLSKLQFNYSQEVLTTGEVFIPQKRTFSISKLEISLLLWVNFAPWIRIQISIPNACKSMQIRIHNTEKKVLLTLFLIYFWALRKHTVPNIPVTRVNADPGSDFFQSRNKKIPDPGSGTASKIFSISTQKIVSKLRVVHPGSGS
jgi:hypothetical protein